MESLIKKYKNFERFLLDGLWRERRHKSWLVALGYKLMRLAFVLFREISGGQITLRAMSLVYTTLLSLVPLLAVSFSVLKAFGVHNQVEPFLLKLIEPLGPEGAVIVNTLLEFVGKMQVGVLGFLGLALLIYTVISLIEKIEEAFNYVWHTKGTRSLSRRFTDYLSVVMVGPLLVFAAMGITASFYSSSFVQQLLAIEPFGTLVVLSGKVLPFLFIIAAFTFFYIFVPNTRVHTLSALIGALVGGTLWQVTGMLFASFVAGSTKYAAIYSGFAILILFMIWLYVSWLILLFGSQIAYFHQHPEQIKIRNERIPLSARLTERLGLAILHLVNSHFHQGKPPWSLDALSERFAIPGEALMEVIEILQQHGYLIESGNEQSGYLLARADETISLVELRRLLRRRGEALMGLDEEALALAAVDEELAQLEAVVEEHLQGRSLADLLESHEDEDAVANSSTER